jgi:hypothetical protein
MSPNIADSLDLRTGTQAVVLVGILLICYYLYAIEKRQRQQLRAMHHQTKGVGNALSAIHQEVRPEEVADGEPPEGVQAAQEAVEAEAGDAEGNE